MKENHEDQMQNPQFASAERDAILRINNQNSVHKIVYLVRTKDPENANKLRVFAALKKLETINTLEVIGFEILNNNKTKKTQKLDKSEVLEKAEEENIIQLFFPWHTIVDIQNLNYQHNKQKQVK
jgi:hypothetical protein